MCSYTPRVAEAAKLRRSGRWPYCSAEPWRAQLPLADLNACFRLAAVVGRTPLVPGHRHLAMGIRPWLPGERPWLLRPRVPVTCVKCHGRWLMVVPCHRRLCHRLVFQVPWAGVLRIVTMWLCDCPSAWRMVTIAPADPQAAVQVVGPWTNVSEILVPRFDG